jgi:hypothetical protein
MTEGVRNLRLFWAEGVDLAALKAVLGDKRLSWFYGERMEDVSLDWLTDLLQREDSAALERFAVGRAFGVDLEVDWWKGGDGYRLRAMLEDGNPPNGAAWEEATSPNLESLPGDDHQLVLWGTYDEEMGAWAEARIPRPLPHPVSWEGVPPDRAALRVRDYRRDGAVVLMRFLKVEPY